MHKGVEGLDELGQHVAEESPLHKGFTKLRSRSVDLVQKKRIFYSEILVMPPIAF